MKQKPRQQRNAERRSKERIEAWSRPRSGGDESTPCSTNVDNNAVGCTYIQVQESYLAKERGVEVTIKIPPGSLIHLVQEAVENLIDAQVKAQNERERIDARARKLAYIASELADRLNKKEEPVRYTDFGIEEDDYQVEYDWEFEELADRLVADETSDCA